MTSWRVLTCVAIMIQSKCLAFVRRSYRQYFSDKGTRYVEHVHWIFVTAEYHSYRWKERTFAFALKSRIFAYTHQSNRVPIYATLIPRNSGWSLRVHSLSQYVLSPISLILYMIVVHPFSFYVKNRSASESKMMSSHICLHLLIWKCYWFEFYCKLIVLISHNMFLNNFDLISMFCSTAIYFHIDSSVTHFFELTIRIYVGRSRRVITSSSRRSTKIFHFCRFFRV